MHICFVTQKGRAAAGTATESDGCWSWGDARSKSKGNFEMSPKYRPYNSKEELSGPTPEFAGGLDGDGSQLH